MLYTRKKYLALNNIVPSCRWDKKPGVRILFGRWQEKLSEIQEVQYDGIFFDTYSEHYVDMQDFHEELPNMLREGGVYSFFNGLGASTNAFFHTVYCRLVELELKKCGFQTSYLQAGKSWFRICLTDNYCSRLLLCRSPWTLQKAKSGRE